MKLKYGSFLVKVKKWLAAVTRKLENMRWLSINLLLLQLLFIQASFSKEADAKLNSTTYRLLLRPAAVKGAIIVDAKSYPSDPIWAIQLDRSSNRSYYTEELVFPVESFVNWLVSSGRFADEIKFDFLINLSEDNRRTRFVKKIITDSLKGIKDENRNLTSFSELISKKYLELHPHKIDGFNLPKLKDKNGKTYQLTLNFKGGENWAHVDENGNIEITTTFVYFSFTIKAVDAKIKNNGAKK